MVIAGFGWIPTTTPHVVAPIPTQTPAQLATVFTQAMGAPLPRPPTAYEQGWTGEHCQFIYTEDTVLDWPAVPTFKGETQ